MDKINVPDSDDPEWQSEQLRIIAHHLENLQDMITDEVMSKSLESAQYHLEALRQYSGY